MRDIPLRSQNGGPIYPLDLMVFGGVVLLMPVTMMFDYSSIFEALAEAIQAIQEISLIGKVTLMILLINQLLFLIMIPLCLWMVAAGLLGLGLVADGGWLAKRAWGMFLSVLLFPVAAAAVTIGTWKLFAGKCYDSAIFISFLPWMSIVSFFYWLE